MVVWDAAAGDEWWHGHSWVVGLMHCWVWEQVWLRDCMHVLCPRDVAQWGWWAASPRSWKTVVPR